MTISINGTREAQRMLSNILQHGILPGKSLEERKISYTPSYDGRCGQYVYLNEITSALNVLGSLHGEGSSCSFYVALEEKIDWKEKDHRKKGIIAKAYSQRKQKDVVKLWKDHPQDDYYLQGYPYERKIYEINELILKDKAVLRELSEKAKRTALFVVNPKKCIGLQNTMRTEKEATHVPPSAIDQIYIHEDFNIKKTSLITPVASIKRMVTIAYSDEQQKRSVKRHVHVPNYAKLLIERLQSNPKTIYTHITRF